MILTFRPLKNRPDTWRPADAERPASRFDSTYTATLDLLDRELVHLKATAAFLQVDLADPVNGVRVDGQLRANAKVVHPGVILTIETRTHGTLVYPCDRFRGGWGQSGTAWQQNLRAIALGLEALRKVERYGIAERGQQYAGFAELGSGDGMPAPMGGGSMSIQDAAEFLSIESGRVVTAEQILNTTVGGEHAKRAYRVAARKHHPDHGGDGGMFALVREARTVLLGGVTR